MFPPISIPGYAYKEDKKIKYFCLDFPHLFSGDRTLFAHQLCGPRNCWSARPCLKMPSGGGFFAGQGSLTQQYSVCLKEQRRNMAESVRHVAGRGYLFSSYQRERIFLAHAAFPGPLNIEIRY